LSAKPEPTQLEHLSDASFLQGKLLVLPASVRLDWKVFVRCKCSSFFRLVVSNEEKSFCDNDTWKICFVENWLGLAKAWDKTGLSLAGTSARRSSLNLKKEGVCHLWVQSFALTFDMTSSVACSCATFVLFKYPTPDEV
jgi:hypothetical protein